MAYEETGKIGFVSLGGEKGEMTAVYMVMKKMKTNSREDLFVWDKN